MALGSLSAQIGFGPQAPRQLYAKNLLTDVEAAVDASSQDQMDPDIHEQRIVWQDHRDVGPGEIYFKNLNSNEIRRITNEPAGQYHPVIEDQWIVWAENSDLQFDLYGYNFYRDTILRLTDSPEDETRPRLNGQWMVYEEDSVGEQQINLRLMYLVNQATVQLTNAPSTTKINQRLFQARWSGPNSRGVLSTRTPW